MSFESHTGGQARVIPRPEKFGIHMGVGKASPSSQVKRKADQALSTGLAHCRAQ